VRHTPRRRVCPRFNNPLEGRSLLLALLAGAPAARAESAAPPQGAGAPGPACRRMRHARPAYRASASSSLCIPWAIP
jgi:hypothetical protein